MAIIVHKANGTYEQINSGATLAVNEAGSLMVRDNGGYVVAIYGPSTWYDAVTNGDYTPVNDKGEPITR